jgi:hypothetical protein
MKKTKRTHLYLLCIAIAAVVVVGGCSVPGSGGSTGAGPSAVNLATAGDFTILAETSITSVPASAITGDIGISPATVTAFTGFSESADLSGTFATSPQVTGKMYAAGMTTPTPAKMTTAVADMVAAYNDAAGRTNPDHINLATGLIGGLTLSPGLYNWAGAVLISTDVTLSGGPLDVWIFQVAGTLTVANAAKIVLSGGALAKNVYWQVASGAIVGTTARVEGIILSKTAITLATGATMTGRALAQTAVTLQSNTITKP